MRSVTQVLKELAASSPWRMAREVGRAIFELSLYHLIFVCCTSMDECRTNHNFVRSFFCVFHHKVRVRSASEVPWSHTLIISTCTIINHAFANDLMCQKDDETRKKEIERASDGSGTAKEWVICYLLLPVKLIIYFNMRDRSARID